MFWNWSKREYRLKKNIAEYYPDLEVQDIRACIEYAMQVVAFAHS